MGEQIMTCTQCGEDAMYDRRQGERCANCGHIEKPKTGLIDERPTKPYDAECGELIVEGNRRSPLKKCLCNDGTSCSFSPTTMKQLETGQWIAVCTTHDE